MSALSELILTPGERNSNVWLKLRSAVEETLESYRLRLEKPQPEADTALVRGRIEILRSILDLGKDRPPEATFGDEAHTTQSRWA